MSKTILQDLPAALGPDLWPVLRAAKRATADSCGVGGRMVVKAIPLTIILILVQVAIKVLEWWLNRDDEPDGPDEPVIRAALKQESVI